MVSVRQIDRFLETWQMEPGICTGGLFWGRRPGSGPFGKLRRWHAIWLLGQGWTASGTAQALGRDPHTIGRWAAAFGEGGPAALIFDQSGGSPRPRRDAAGGDEGSGARTVCHGRDRTGQLELESGPPVRLRTLRRQPEP